MLADRLKIARKKAGLSLRDLAERLDPPVSAQALSKYEAGKMMPGSSVLVGLAKALGSSVDFLLSGEVAALDGIEFRRHSASSAKDRAVVEAMVTEKLERIFAIEDVLGLSEPADAFEELEARAVTSLEEAEEQAERLREAWDLGGDPMPSVIALLEDKGIHVIEVALPERVSGMACSVKRAGREGSTAVIVVSGDINTERKRFTLAHELGHRIIRQVSDDVRLEKAIDRFAGAFLVPAAHLKAEVGSQRHGVAYQEIKRLKHAYGVSASMMLVRMRQLGILPEHVVDYAFRTYARDWRLREPDEIPSGSGFAALEKPIRFERLVYRALAEKMISPIRAAELLERPLTEVEAGLRGPQVQ